MLDLSGAQATFSWYLCVKSQLNDNKFCKLLTAVWLALVKLKEREGQIERRVK